jgi:hypothetical protein
MNNQIESRGRRNFFKTAAEILGLTAAAGVTEETLRKGGFINNWFKEKIAEATGSNIAAYAVRVPGERFRTVPDNLNFGDYMVVDFLDVHGNLKTRKAYFMEWEPVVEDSYDDSLYGHIRTTPFTYMGFMNKYFPGFPSSPSKRKLLDKLCVDYNRGRPITGSSVAIPTRQIGPRELSQLIKYMANNDDAVKQIVGETK